MDRHEELRVIANNLRAGDFEKVAQGPGMTPDAMGGMPMGGDPAAMGGMPPELTDPAMFPMAGDAGGTGSEGGEAAKGMKEVALRALDLTQGAVDQVLGSDGISPADKVDATAAALETSGGLQGIPPEEIAALAQTPPPAAPTF